jgi:L-amino acid N-acyltransferase YncA
MDTQSIPLTVAATLRDLLPEDWPAVRAIYEQGIRSGEGLGESGGVWRDVLLLERRSSLVGR